MIELIKKILKSNSVGKAIYPYLNKVYRIYSVRARKRRLKKYGVEVLAELVGINSKYNMGIVPIFGTLLGFVREGGFMKHDDDIDVAVLPGLSVKEILDIFVDKYGYKFRHGLAYHGQCTEFTLEHKSGLTVDFFMMVDSGENLLASVYFWKNGVNYADVRQNNLKWVRHPYVTGLKTFSFAGVEVEIPANSEDWLYYEFGSDWRIPIPNHTDARQPGKLLVDDYGYTTTYEEIMNNSIPQ